MVNVFRCIRILICTAWFPILLGDSAAGQPATESAPASGEARPPRYDAVHVEVSSVKGAKRCLLIRGPDRISVSASSPANFQFRIVNLLEEQVFVQVNQYDDLSLTIKGPRGTFRGGGSFFYDPTDTGLYKLLTGASYRDGTPKFTLLSVTTVQGRLPLSELEDVDEWVGASGEVSVVVFGFLRRNGKPFAETVKLPVTIVE